MKITLIAPPLTQPNTAYPAVPVLTRFLREEGHVVQQHDFSVALLQRLFTPEMIRRAATAVIRRGEGDPEELQAVAEEFAAAVPAVLRFLQGKDHTLAWRIASGSLLPTCGYFRNALDEILADDGEGYFFGSMGVADKAKIYASAFMDDLAALLASGLDPDFGFGKYAESLGESLPSFQPLLQRLEETPPTAVDEIIDELTTKMLEEDHPQWVGISVPFPGTLYGAFRIARQIRRLRPEVKIILGGGYVNSELRELEEPRVFDYVDFIAYDEGFSPLRAILNGDYTADDSQPSAGCTGKGAHEVPQRRLRTAQGWQRLTRLVEHSPLLVPDYRGLDMDAYFSILERPNPMHRLWSDGKWLKLQLTRGCYWHKCTFCDTRLDYIGRFQSGSPQEIADAMERLLQETGLSGFHFTDEAVPPALLKQLSRELIRRKLPVSWWANIRFDRSFDEETVALMSQAGCIAVSGGLECAQDRLLKLMNKGIDCAGAAQVLRRISQHGIMVHAYLMYGFPTQTVQEAAQALEYVRNCFSTGIVHSAFWHRFALTVHSEAYRQAGQLGIHPTLPPTAAPRFALNAVEYREEHAPDWSAIGKKLAAAVYNYSLGLELETPAEEWLREFLRQTPAKKITKKAKSHQAKNKRG